jgi:hypothetical protein
MQLIQTLQAKIKLIFHQARKDPTQQPVASFKALNDNHVEVFEDATTLQLRRSLVERRNFPDREVSELVCSNTFVVLDAQSAQDQTIVVHEDYGVMDERTERTVGMILMGSSLELSQTPANISLTVCRFALVHVAGKVLRGG